MRFDALLGNEGLKRRLSAGGDRLSHCYILEGPPGSGRKTLSRILAAAYQCTGQGSRPCGVCPDCKKVFGGIHPDVITVDSDKATVPIALIRDMQADAYILPNEGRRKVYVIPRAGDMQAPAQNALLKLLEEPPEYCAFLLITDTAEKLLETVRSRSVLLTMAPLSRQTLLDRLRQEDPSASEADLARAADRSDGYLGAAIALLHTPETELDQELLNIARGFAAGEDYALLNVLVPLEKRKRQDLLELLTELRRVFLRAMTPGAARTLAAQALSGCTPQSLYTAAGAIGEAIALLQANGSAGHAVAVLTATMR